MFIYIFISKWSQLTYIYLISLLSKSCLDSQKREYKNPYKYMKYESEKDIAGS